MIRLGQRLARPSIRRCSRISPKHSANQFIRALKVDFHIRSSLILPCHAAPSRKRLFSTIQASSTLPPNVVKPSKPKKVVYLPGFVKATQLAGLLNTKLQAVIKFARANRFKFQKHSEIVLDWHHAKALAENLGFRAVYYGSLLTMRPISNQKLTDDCSWI
jgi:hypothetical protein